MSRVTLTGLNATDPLGFLAGVGLLRVVSNRGTFGAAKLAWSDEPPWPAELVTEKDCDADALVADLVAHMTGRGALPAYSGRTPAGETVGPEAWDDIKVKPPQYREWLLATRPAATATARESADYLSAFGSELIVAVSGEKNVKPTALHMTSGNQKFLASCRNLADTLATTARNRSTPAAAFREALVGPWGYCDGLSAMGFDSDTEAIYALVADAPGPAGPSCTRAAVWLAVEAIPLFPCTPSRGRLHTRGFDHRATAFRWPVWGDPLSVAAVRTLVGVKELHADPTGDAIRALGVRAVMESARVTFGQGYGQLRPAVRLPATG